MALRSCIGTRFSQLADNYDKAPYFWWSREDVRRYTRRGTLPDGAGFGVAKTPTQENSYAQDVVVVAEDGEVLACGCVFPDADWAKYFQWPRAMAASPSGNTIVWLGKTALFAWRRDGECHRFFSGDLDHVAIPGDVAVLDACMREDGSLDLWCEDGTCYVYLCDEDTLVCSDAGGTTFLCLTRSSVRRGGDIGDYVYSRLHVLPEVSGLLIAEGAPLQDYGLAYVEVRELRLSPRVERIEEGWFARLQELRRAVVPAGVKRVEGGAFAHCEKLSELVIEGDLSRLADWAEDAFVGCPCMEEYLALRQGALATATEGAS